jgi:proline iminopeptidase
MHRKERISSMPIFTQNLLKKIMTAKAFDSPHYHEIENAFTSQFMIRLSPRPDIFTASLKHMNSAIYKELQGPSQFILSGMLQSWSVTEELWKIQGNVKSEFEHLRASFLSVKSLHACALL